MAEPKYTDLVLLNAILEESKQAKQILRDLGFGVTGTNLLRTVMEAAEEIKALRND